MSERKTDLVERLWASDEASALTNEAARALDQKDAEIAALKERVGELTAPHGPLCSCRHCYSRQFQRAIEGE